MISGISRFLVFVQLILASLFLHLASTHPANASYQAQPSNADYRSLSTLNDFTRMVYRGRWDNIEAEYVLEQFAKFKTPQNSPAMRDIWRDVLLGDFKGLEIDNAKQQTALMAERLRLLNRLGFFDEAVRLYQKAAEKKPVPAAIAYQGIEAMALAGSADGACLEVTMAAKDLAGDAWDQDNALCAAYFGETERAKEIYTQVSAKAGAGFRTVYKMLNKQMGKAIHVGIPPLWRTLLLAQGATVTTDALKKADAMTLSSMAVNPHVPLGTRLNAAMRAADKGTFGFERLRKLYEAARPSETGLGDVVATAKAGGTLSPADYYAAARFTFEGNERGTIVKNAMQRLNPITTMKSQVYGWIVDKMTLQVKKLGWFAPYGFANMVTTNRMGSARMYYEAGNLHKSPLSIVYALVEGQLWLAEQRAVWEDAMRAAYKDKANQRIDLMMKVALAYDQENKLGLQNPGKTTHMNNSILETSIRNGGRGLTLVTALNLLTEKPVLTNLSTEQFVDIITKMSKEGLFGERKKITLEFLIQSVL